MSQTSNPQADYFEYLENVLGIKSILQSKASPSSTVQTELLFAVQDYQNYQADEMDLLQKMIAAVKVDLSRLAVCDLNQVQLFQTQVCVVFQDEALKIELPTKLLVQTFSPRVLLKKPELKKTAWTELQKILTFFT